METIMTIFGPIITFVAMVGGMIALYFSLRRPIENLDDKFEKRFDQVDARFDQVDARFDRVEARIDRVEMRIEDFSRDLAELRLDATSMLARHDERLSSLERQGPKLQLR